MNRDEMAVLVVDAFQQGIIKYKGTDENDKGVKFFKCNNLEFTVRIKGNNVIYGITDELFGLLPKRLSLNGSKVIITPEQLQALIKN